MDAQRHHPKESGPLSILRDVTHDHFGLVGLQVASGISPRKSAYGADDWLYGPIEGTRRVTTAHQPVNGSPN